MKLRQFLSNSNVLQNVFRRYVSSVSINVQSLTSIHVKSRDFMETSDNKVKFTLCDAQQKEIEASKVDSFKVLNTKDAFKLDFDGRHELSLILELPVESSPDVCIEIIAGCANVQVGNLQAKAVDVKLDEGHVGLKNLKSESIRALTERGDIKTQSILLGKIIQLNISIEKSQGDNLEVEGTNVVVDSCYSTSNKFKSTREAILKNLHANSTIQSSGGKFKLSGFSGTLQAVLDNDDVEIQLSELYGDSNISTTNAHAEIKLGLSEKIIKETDFKLSSHCAIENSINELIVCQFNPNSFKINHDGRDSRLKVKIEEGKSLKLSKMSWIDSLKLKSSLPSI
ncbi:CLUMA_CG018729, isoform A [Clunio marinus]|uniref:CLUMA_CG018729, isoform A n=1 Tax=Clunio marinus TaxID=568069 RepID=A0A1J1J4A4_9DIPT|nr:CLUMA_CG018729, isoform A [Clunio marinus]